jgi:hypothetical protein
MELTEFKTRYFKSRFWRIKAVFRAMIFAYRNPRHVQVSIEETKAHEFSMKANYAGINERGFLRVLNELGNEAYFMDKTENEFKKMLE